MNADTLAPPAREAEACATESPSPAEPLRVLVVDDDMAVARSIERLLTRRHMEVETAASAVDAMSAILRNVPDVVICDLNLREEGDGISLLRAIREDNPVLPVILMSGQPTVDSAMEAVNLKAFGYLRKPVRSTELVERILTAGRYGRISRAGLEAAAVAEDESSMQARFDRAHESLWMAYQPVIDARWQIRGFEALVRNEEATLRNPPDLFDLSFAIGRSIDLSHRIWALSAIPFLDRNTKALLFLNIDPRQLGDEPIIPEAHPLSRIAHRVVLEITERASSHDIANLEQKIASLRERGFRIAVDDMGVGYSGLTAFAKIEPEFVKIDGSLIRRVNEHDARQKLIKSITGLCADLGIQVVAEGIETEAEFEAMLELGADLFQGFFVGRPKPWGS